MSCECECASCTDFCDCQRCSKPETDLLTSPENRPGLDAIQARIGDYGAFFSDAKRRLSSKESPNLQTLGTRDPTDPTIALLDAWSVTADVLTFYRERITQEAYLRTATDETSLRELANLVGFKPRPGIAATTHLAYLLDPSAKPVEIKPGAKAQTVPLPDEKMQTFETDEKLYARAEWSQMKPRQSRLTNIDMFNALTRSTIRLAGTSIFVRPGERVLFVFSMKLGDQVVREVLSANINIELGFVELTLKPRAGLHDTDKERKLIGELNAIRDLIKKELDNNALDKKSKIIGKFLLDVISSYFLGTDATEAFSLLKAEPLRGGDLPFIEEVANLIAIFEDLHKSTSPEPKEISSTTVDDILNTILKSAKGELSSSGIVLQRVNDGLQPDGVARIELAQNMVKEFQGAINPALSVMQPDSFPVAPSIYLLKTLANSFGTTAPRQNSSKAGVFKTKEWELDAQDTRSGAAFLDTVVDGITADSFAIISSPVWSNQYDSKDEVSPERLLRFAQVRSAQTIQRNTYQSSGKITRLELTEPDSLNNMPLSLVFPKLTDQLD